MTSAAMRKEEYSPAEIAAVKATADLVAIIGGKVALKKRGDHFVGLCPFHNEGTGSFCVFPKKQNFHCFGCSESGDIFEWLKKTEGLSFGPAMARLKGDSTLPRRRFISASAATAQTQDDAEALRKKIDKARKIWGEASSPYGTVIEKYLIARGIGGIVIPPSLRFHPACWHPQINANLPAMIAAVTDSRSNIVGIHRTFLEPDGKSKLNRNYTHEGKLFKADAKMMLGSCRGNTVWLQPVALSTLAIAEGIETALTVAAAMPNIGVWAALSLGNMDAIVPGTLRELILCADGDNKDPKKADAVLEAAVRKHRERNPTCKVRIARPAKGKDFNDMVRG